jgi:hypothetical protein
VWKRLNREYHPQVRNPDPPLDENERLWRFANPGSNDIQQVNGVWIATTTSFFSRTCLGDAQQGVSVFLPAFSDIERLRKGIFEGWFIVELTVGFLTNFGFSIWEAASDVYPDDRHCLIRPNDSWTKSQYRKQASLMAHSDSVRILT